MKTVSVRRGDSFGYQLASRMIIEMMCDKLKLPYMHNPVPIYKKHNKSQYCIDHMYESITGGKNASDVELLDKAGDVKWYTGFPGFLKSEIPRRVSPLFTRKHFIKYTAFMNIDKDLNVYETSTTNIVVHIRRGDVLADNYGRCLDDQIYIDQLNLAIDKYKDRGNIKIYIETDSPKKVDHLAETFSASINVTSDITNSRATQPPASLPTEHKSEWMKCIYVLQSLYNIATADVFIPSRSSFSVLGGIIGNAEIFSQRFKIGRIKDPSLLFPATRDDLNISPACERLKHDAVWLHYLPLINMDSITEL